MQLEKDFNFGIVRFYKIMRLIMDLTFFGNANSGYEQCLEGLWNKPNYKAVVRIMNTWE